MPINKRRSSTASWKTILPSIPSIGSKPSTTIWRTISENTRSVNMAGSQRLSARFHNTIQRTSVWKRLRMCMESVPKRRGFFSCILVPTKNLPCWTRTSWVFSGIWELKHQRLHRIRTNTASWNKRSYNCAKKKAKPLRNSIWRFGKPDLRFPDFSNICAIWHILRSS